jgi:histidinol dehydrogenase
VPTYVQHGGADLGVAGLDVLLEHGSHGLYQPLDLKIARCRMSVATRADFDYAAAVRQGSRIRVATKYTQIAREHFAAKGVHVDLIKLYGSMELAPLTGLADAIVDLVSTGSTLKANHLVEVEQIMDISSRLVVNQAALKLKREPIRALIDAFEAAWAKRRHDRRLRAPVATASADFEAEFQRVLHWSAETDAAIEQRVAEILADVRARGDAAVLELHARFDGLQAPSMAALEIGADELHAALDASRRRSAARCEAAAARVRDYHQRQLDACCRSWQYRDADGTLLGQKVTPLDRVGIYVPGGKAAYPSSVLMNAMPAHVAGVGEIIMVVPTPAWPPVGGQKERNATLVLAAAAVAGVTAPSPSAARRPWRAGLRHGHRAARRQDHRPRQRLRGQRQAARVRPGRHRHDRRAERDPGAGRRQHAGRLGGDGPVQPGRARRAGAEHPAVPRRGYIAAVREAIDRLLPGMPRRDVIRASLEGRGALIHTRSMEEACAISNRIAPEHLEVSSARPAPLGAAAAPRRRDLPGRLHQRSLGDYCAGPNHVLPTSGTARFSSPLGVYDFQKRSSLIEVSEAGAQVLGPIAAELAYGEGLQAHAQAAELRLKATAR